MGEDWPAALDRGIAGVAHEGEERSGDLAVFVPTAAGGLACVIDGLGHGPEAADAAELCADVVRANAEAGARELMEACHEALLKTRGVVMTVAWFDLERSQLSWAGVGNVDARLVRSGPEQREDVALVFGGVLGYRMPQVRAATMRARARRRAGDDHRRHRRRDLPRAGRRRCRAGAGRPDSWHRTAREPTTRSPW